MNDGKRRRITTATKMLRTILSDVPMPNSAVLPLGQLRHAERACYFGASPLIYAIFQASAIRTSRPFASRQSIFKNSGERPSLLMIWSSTLLFASSCTRSRRFLLLR